jgi:chemotaxis signal transduction protein
MTVAIETSLRSFVLFQLGERRFALASESVGELVSGVRLFDFPHTTPLLSGVLVRRGCIIPVYDVSPVLLDQNLAPRKLFLIVRRQFGSSSEWSAISVSGECELVRGEVQPAEDRPEHVLGLLSIGGETLEVIDLEKALAGHPAGFSGDSAPEAQP